MQSDTVKEDVKKAYAKIALNGNSDRCCMPSAGGECCSGDFSTIEAAKFLGYDQNELQSIPADSILGVGCGAPLNFAEIREGEMVVDLGSGAGIDVFLSANKVGRNGKVIGIDMTVEMLGKAIKNAKENGYSSNNEEFRKGDIEKQIPVEDNSADLVIINCVINLTISKIDTFREIYRILKDGGRMVISDLVTDKDVQPESIAVEKWCSCIDGALTKENYLESITKAGFDKNIKVLEERLYIAGDQVNGRKIISLVIKAVK